MWHEIIFIWCILVNKNRHFFAKQKYDSNYIENTHALTGGFQFFLIKNQI